MPDDPSKPTLEETFNKVLNRKAAECSSLPATERANYTQFLHRTNIQFRKLATKLRESQEERYPRELEEEKRKLRNRGHDLNTPLASMRAPLSEADIHKMAVRNVKTAQRHEHEKLEAQRNALIDDYESRMRQRNGLVAKEAARDKTSQDIKAWKTDAMMIRHETEAKEKANVKEKEPEKSPEKASKKPPENSPPEPKLRTPLRKDWGRDR